MCYAVAAIVPDRDGKDFVPSEVILDAGQNPLVTSVMFVVTKIRQ
jgi:hypothetical protein